MAIDLSSAPWNRLAKLAPPLTAESDLLDAATRHEPLVDIYAAAADLWEEKAFSIDVSPDVAPSNDTDSALVSSVSQDGISVHYADTLNVNSQTTRMAQRQKFLDTATWLRKKSKMKTTKLHTPEYDPFTNRLPYSDDDEDGIFIPVIP